MRRLSVLIAVSVVTAGAQGTRANCASDNAGLTVPAGFCVQLVADSVGIARHVTVAPNGDLFVAIRNTQTSTGGVLVLRDANGDGVAEVRRRFGIGGGSEILFHDGYLYFGTDTAIVRWRWNANQLEPSGPPDTVAYGLTAERGHHAAKTFTIASDGWLYVNIGAPSNACESQRNTQESQGQTPCPLLTDAGGIWRFDTKRLKQRQSDGERWATGIRNIVAISVDPSGQTVWGAQHGRDMLAGNWGKKVTRYTNEMSAENPGEELFRLDKGLDYGWPYCYYDIHQKKKVMAPEYGGDGVESGRCASVGQPMAAYPGHWAPNALAFYAGSAFPATYRGGAFIAFHGSWNRAPLAQAGFRVVFQPFRNGRPSGDYVVFADGFRGAPTEMRYRPTGLAMARDGSLIVTDDRVGRIYRIRWIGTP